MFWIDGIDHIPDKLIKERFPDGFGVRDEANALVAWTIRNGPLEGLHSGEPSEFLDEPGLSRITDAEMKALMINARDQLEKRLRLRDADLKRYLEEIFKYNLAYCRGWNR